jgi:hypothetical protein
MDTERPRTTPPGTSAGQTSSAAESSVGERESYERYRTTHAPHKPGLMEEARDGAIRQLDKQRARAANGLTSVVEAVRRSGHQMEGDNATMASIVDNAANQME